MPSVGPLNKDEENRPSRRCPVHLHMLPSLQYDSNEPMAQNTQHQEVATRALYGPEGRWEGYCCHGKSQEVSPSDDSNVHPLLRAWCALCNAELWPDGRFCSPIRMRAHGLCSHLGLWQTPCHP